MKIEKQYPFTTGKTNFNKQDNVRKDKSVDLSSKVVAKRTLTADLNIVQKGIYFGLYESSGKEILSPEYDDFFQIDEKGVLIFRKTDYGKQESSSKRYGYGLLNIYTKTKTNVLYRRITKLCPGLYDVQKGTIDHTLVKSDCIPEKDFYRKIEVLSEKIIYLSGWATPRIVNPDGIDLFLGMDVSAEDFRYGHYATANIRSETWIVDDNGEKIKKLPFKKISGLRNGYAPVSDGEKWGYSDVYGRLVVPCKYDFASPIDDAGNVNVQKTDFLHKMWGVTTIKFTDLLKQHH